MRIYCDKCKAKARITTSREISAHFRQLYCSCSNSECGHSFVMDVTFSHTLSPSALDLSPALLDRMRRAAPGQMGSLFDLVAGAG